ncbi:MAG: hypothetical protein MPN21_06410 [Thermoanaerobaculia bacterium]|nr:hypothetical protein [Thermoanaerobaculia bacterium]
MQRSLFLLLALSLFLVPAAFAEETLVGEYQWDQGGASGDLRAVFEPTGDNTWEVSFYFDFRSKPHVYSGTATGSLEDGTLEGTVKNENKRRTFTFEGSFQNGEFRGNHAETTRGEPIRTGTLTLAQETESSQTRSQSQTR